MLKPCDQELIQKCYEILKKVDASNHKHISNIAHDMVLGHSSIPLNNALNMWSKSDTALPERLKALIECQSMVMQARIPEWFQQGHAQCQQELTLHFERFHHISTALISMDEQLRINQEKTSTFSSLAPQEKRTLSTSISLWKEKGKLTCLNYYKGLPVQCTAMIEDIRESDACYITIPLSHELLRVLAMTEQTSMLALAASNHQLIQLYMHHCSKNDITFTTKNTAIFQKRQYLRLQPSDPIEILILQQGKAIGSGHIIDLSTKHIHISMVAHLCQSFQLEEVLTVHMTFNKQLIQGMAWIRDMRFHEESCILRLEFFPNAKVQRSLQAELASLQRKIIQEIREKTSLLFQ